MQTPNLIDKNVEQIAKLFPNVITETKDDAGNIKKGIDFDLLKQCLSDVLVDDEDERYRLDWPGKKASLLKANTPINKTLRPCREESVDFETTKNLYIEGDNFEVLKILQESYLGKIKMIYIDPPYNTGKDFIYNDNFKISKDEYEEEIGAVGVDGEKLFKNTDSNGMFHSDWLSMMYERLIVARDLLKDDGVIFISIDDNEVHNLRKICDEIFGDENCLGIILWKKKTNGNNMGHIPPVHDYFLCYAKSVSDNCLLGFPLDKDFIQKNYKNPDNDIRGAWTTSDLSANHKGPYFPIQNPNNHEIYYPAEGRYWVFNERVVKERIADGRIIFGKSGKSAPVQKKFLSERESQRFKAESWWDSHGFNSDGMEELASLLGKKKVFDHPKPSLTLKHLCNIVTQQADMVLDFYAGTSPTAHAVMKLNAEDNGNRKFIMVQLPEKTDEKSEAYKAGYKTIAEIGKERIRLAGKKIKEDNKDKKGIEKLDIGFRVYKTDLSNMKDVYYHPEELEQKNLPGLESNIEEDRTPDDLLTQVILDLGLELSLHIEKKDILGNTVFIVQTNALVACFEDNIDFNIVDKIAELKPFKVIFKDASFADDKDRINVEERFKLLSPETVITVI